MAKILVADDNSNIQKMVGLALKDQGIDVVAVGNGEAAVRKAMDIKPDLILADVFMPVRNGYEVCEYVKNEETLKHIPVILLVGAFDPLDEQEAQRVGADGVLKKPFVPPDPLISMVKAALTRAGVSIGGVPAPKVAPIPELRVSDLIAPRKEREPQIPVLATMPAILPPADQEFTAPIEEQSFVDELPAPPAPVTFEAGSSAVAFGNLLNATAAGEEDDAAFQASAQLAMDRDFKKKNQNEEAGESEEDPAKPSWRRDDVDSQANPDFGTSGAVKDWRDTALADIPARPQAREAWENPEQPATHTEAAQSGEAVVTAVKEFPAQETKEIPQNMPFAGDSWAAAISAGAEEKRNEIAVRGEAAQDRAVEPAVAVSETEKTLPANGWLATAPSPWDADAKKATHLATGWDHPASEPAAPAVGSGDTAAAAEALLPAATVEVIREEASQAARDAEQAQHSAAATVVPATAAGGTTPAEPSMDELVARVLAKMTPEALQAVTREILKPVVEAMIREELSKK